MWKLYSLVSLLHATCFMLSNIKKSLRILSNSHIKTKIDLTKKTTTKKKKIEKPMFSKINNLCNDWDFAAKDIHHFRNS